MLILTLQQHYPISNPTGRLNPQNSNEFQTIDMPGATRKREKQWERATFDSFCFKFCKFSGLLKIYPSVMAPAKYSYKLAYKLHLEYNMAILTGDTAVIPPGHNARVVGNEQMVGIDFTGLKDYAKEGSPQASSRLSRKGEE